MKNNHNNQEVEVLKDIWRIRIRVRLGSLYKCKRICYRSKSFCIRNNFKKMAERVLVDTGVHLMEVRKVLIDNIKVNNKSSKPSMKWNNK